MEKSRAYMSNQNEIERFCFTQFTKLLKPCKIPAVVIEILGKLVPDKYNSLEIIHLNNFFNPVCQITGRHRKRTYLTLSGDFEDFIHKRMKSGILICAELLNNSVNVVPTKKVCVASLHIYIKALLILGICEVSNNSFLERILTLVFNAGYSKRLLNTLLNGKNKIDYYEIAVDDKLIDQQVEMFQSRSGHYEQAEVFDPEQRDLLKGDLRELDENGNTLEGGITVEGASLMPQYIKVEDQKKLFDGAKLGDIITFNPTAAYPDNDIEVSSLLKIKKEEVAEHKGNFSYQITEISRFVKAENNAELWKSVYGEDADIKDEAAFRKAIADGLTEQLKGDSNYKFIQDLRAYCEKKVGDLTYPDAILKRIMLANNQDKGEEFVEKNYAQSIKELTWHLIKEQLAKDHNIKVDDNDVRESARQMARAQFAQYGMTNVPEDYLNGYADEMLKKRENVDSFVEAALDRKLAEAIKEVVKLNVKTVSLEEFNKLVSE